MTMITTPPRVTDEWNNLLCLVTRIHTENMRQRSRKTVILVNQSSCNINPLKVGIIRQFPCLSKIKKHRYDKK
jgi:hypothetical protein